MEDQVEDPLSLVAGFEAEEEATTQKQTRQQGKILLNFREGQLQLSSIDFLQLKYPTSEYALRCTQCLNAWRKNGRYWWPPF